MGIPSLVKTIESNFNAYNTLRTPNETFGASRRSHFPVPFPSNQKKAYES